MVIVLEYDALDHHRVSRCDKNLLVMMVSYQDECFDQHEWELEKVTGRINRPVSS